MRPLLFIAAVAVLVGCDSDFNPKGSFRDQMVVFSVVTPARSEAFVRVYTTYDPPGFNPLEWTASNQISAAQVSIAGNGSVYSFRDTTVARDDMSRYQDSIRAFVSSPVTFSRGKAYTLSVTTPAYGTVSGSTIIPDQGFVSIDQQSLPSLSNPAVFRSDVFVYANPSSFGEGHLVQLYLEYEVASNPGVYLREEVPASITNYQNCLQFDAAYPEIRRRQSGSARELWVFPHFNYRAIILKLLKLHEGDVVNFRQVVVSMVQADKNLYSYLSLVNGFRDEFSIRVDQPNYTNIEGGLGLFGSYAKDESSYSVPSTFVGIACSQ